MFMILFVLLYISQLFIISPGSDIIGIRAPVYVITTIGGFTYSSISSLLILTYLLFSIVFNRKRDFSKDKFELIGLWAILAFISIGLVSSVEIGIGDAVQTAMKILMPFCFYYFIRYSFDYKKLDNLYNAVLLINFILIGQVLVCKMLTGKFSASIYYGHILKEEYFGYYNSPHPFAALLGLLCIWNLKCISDRKNSLLNTILFVCNFVMIYLSGVRSYAIAFVLSIGFLMFMSLFGKVEKRIRSLLIVIFIMGTIFSIIQYQHISFSRLDTLFDPLTRSSGRDVRWMMDLAYYLENYDILEKLFGGGFGRINIINYRLFGIYINSLNFIIDLLIDNGVIGMILLIFAYISIIRWCFTQATYIFTASILIYLIIGLFINNLLPYVTVMPLAIIFFVVQKIESTDVESHDIVDTRSVSEVGKQSRRYGFSPEIL